MTDYIKKLKADLVEQFRGKPNIEALVEVIGEQFEDLVEFFEQLRIKRTLYEAEGKQLDGIGDIVVLSRLEAAKMYGLTSAAELPDDVYRKYLIFKILKNTCNCTYYDIMKAIGMFWNGPPLKYSEDPQKPATIIFDFDVTPDIADQVLGLPFVKAGGVGLNMRMTKSDEINKLCFGFSLLRAATITIDCNAPTGSLLTDETGALLVNESGALLTN